MKTRDLFFLIVLILGFGLVSCSSDDKDLDASFDVSSSEVQSATMTDAVLKDADLYIKKAFSSVYSGQGTYKADSVFVAISGSTVTVSLSDTTTFPKTVTVDFGSGVTDSLGYVLKGKLVVYLSNKTWVSGSYKKITYKDFYVNSNKMCGYKTVTYKGLNTGLNQYWAIATRDTLVNGSSKATWNAYLTKERVKLGGDTIKYSTTGYVGGVNSSNKCFTMGITAANPLVTYNFYPYVIKGSASITSEDRTATVDYGDGSLDDKAVFTYNGKTKSITVR